MSFSDAIGQVDQIVQWEQEVADPAALMQTTNAAALTQTTSAAAGDATSTAAGTSASDASSSTSFAEALAEAQAADGTAAVSTTDPSTTADGSVLGGTDNSSDLLGSTGTSSGSDLLGSTGTTSGSDLLGSTGTTSGSDLLGDGDSQLLSALSSLTGNDSTAGGSDSGPDGGTAISTADPRIQAMTEEANALVGKPYVWGGGHDGWGPQSGYDCSGFVSAVLHAGGYLSTPQDTTTLPTSAGIESGPGQYVTIYDRDESGQAGHVIVEINGQFYESGGEQGKWGGGAGVEAISTPSASYLATFDRVLHPAGL